MAEKILAGEVKRKQGLAKVVMIKAETGSRFGLKEGEAMAAPSPLEVDELMKKVPPGKVTTINEIRRAVAKKHKATVGCPF